MKSILKKEIEKLSFQELLELRDSLDSLIDKQKNFERKNLKNQMIELAKSSGMTLDDVLGTASTSNAEIKKRTPAKPKYKFSDPENPSIKKTWTGKGRMPTILVKIADEKKIDIKNKDEKEAFLQEFLIKGDD